MNSNRLGVCRSRVVFHTALLLCSFIAVSCGGGGDGDDSSDRDLGVESPVPEPQHIIARLGIGNVSADARIGMSACIDLNADLLCSSDEPTALLDADHVFSFEVAPEVRLETAAVVAHVRGSQSGNAKPEVTPAYVLAAKVRPSTVLNVLTTLEVVHELGYPLAGGLAARWRLAPNTTFHDVADPDVNKLNELAREAFQNALPFATVGATDEPAAVLATRETGAAVVDVVAGYIDAGTGSLLATASSRVVAAETAQRLKPSACVTEAVASIDITTNDHVPIVSKDEYVRATIRVDGADGVAPQILTTRIRGRGNSTWGMPKKPYRLSLDEATSLLGMPADRDWALLANYADKSLMRNAVAFCLGRMLALDYTPRHRYVELTLNGEYQGVYQVVEHIKVADQRVAIGSLTTLDGDSGMGFLLEVDYRLDADTWFVSSAGQPYAVKSPLSGMQLANIVTYVNAMESTLFGPQFRDQKEGYLRYLEADTLIDFYLVNELLRNADAFYYSTFMHRVRDGRLRVGPLWDFDIAAGNIDYQGNEATEGWRVREASVYLQRLFEDEAFAQHVRTRWAHLSARIPELLAFIAETERVLDEAQTRNFARWPILDVWVWPNAVVTGSYDGEVSYLRAWLTARAVWMDKQLTPQTAS